jgi:hypothetical protein
VFVVSATTVVGWLGSLAPHAVNRPVPASTIPNSACGVFGSVVSATLIDTAAGPGYYTYRVRCSDGVVTEVAQ